MTTNKEKQFEVRYKRGDKEGLHTGSLDSCVKFVVSACHSERGPDVFELHELNQSPEDMNDNKRGVFLAAADKFQAWDENEDELRVTTKIHGFTLSMVPAGCPWADLSDGQMTGLRNWLNRRLEERAQVSKTAQQATNESTKPIKEEMFCVSRRFTDGSQGPALFTSTQAKCHAYVTGAVEFGQFLRAAFFVYEKPEEQFSVWLKSEHGEMLAYVGTKAGCDAYASAFESGPKASSFTSIEVEIRPATIEE